MKFNCFLSCIQIELQPIYMLYIKSFRLMLISKVQNRWYLLDKPIHSNLQSGSRLKQIVNKLDVTNIKRTLKLLESTLKTSHV